MTHITNKFNKESYTVAIEVELVELAKEWCKREFVASNMNLNYCYEISRIRFIDNFCCEFVFVDPGLAARFKLTWQGI